MTFGHGDKNEALKLHDCGDLVAFGPAAERTEPTVRSDAEKLGDEQVASIALRALAAHTIIEERRPKDIVLTNPGF